MWLSGGHSAYRGLHILMHKKNMVTSALLSPQAPMKERKKERLPHGFNKNHFISVFQNRQTTHNGILLSRTFLASSLASKPGPSLFLRESSCIRPCQVASFQPESGLRAVSCPRVPVPEDCTQHHHTPTFSHNRDDNS